jgi:hypothetical protein
MPADQPDTRPFKGKTRFQIKVTPEDIAKAKRNDSYKCVVTQAIARAIPDATRIETDTQTIRFTWEGNRYMFLTPASVQGYVIAFDAGEPLDPFSFHLRDPFPARRNVYAPKGERANRARKVARDTVIKKARTAETPLDPAAVELEAREASKAAYAASIAAENADDPITTMLQPDGRRRVPRVFKRKERAYGHRLLRINQKPAENVKTT